MRVNDGPWTSPLLRVVLLACHGVQASAVQIELHVDLAVATDEAVVSSFSTTLSAVHAQRSLYKVVVVPAVEVLAKESGVKYKVNSAVRCHHFANLGLSRALRSPCMPVGRTHLHMRMQCSVCSIYMCM